jgi:hypothetical protein
VLSFNLSSIAVPPGHYRIELASPTETSDTRSIDAEVGPLATRSVSVEFERVDVAAYLRSQGWTQ